MNTTTTYQVPGAEGYTIDRMQFRQAYRRNGNLGSERWEYLYVLRYNGTRLDSAFKRGELVADVLAGAYADCEA